jgi:mycoredoxin
MRINRGYRSVPTLIFPDGSTLTEPRTSDLVQKLQAIAAATSATPGAAS